MSKNATEQRTCEQHGNYVAENYWGARWSGCRKCEFELRQLEEAAQERGRRTERAQTWLNESGLVGRFAHLEFSDFKAVTPAQAKAMAICQEAVAWYGDWNPVLLLGPPGTGKTMLASIMTRTTIVDHDVRAKCVTARELIMRLRATWRKGSEESELEVINHLGSVSFLAVDEIGVGFGSDAEITQLLDILDLRYRLQRNIVVTSNLGPKELRAATGTRLWDRLREGATLVPCDWPSHRGAAQW